MTLHSVINKLDAAKRAAILSTVLREGTTVQDFVEDLLRRKAEELISARQKRIEEGSAS